MLKAGRGHVVVVSSVQAPPHPPLLRSARRAGVACCGGRRAALRGACSQRMAAAASTAACPKGVRRSDAAGRRNKTPRHGGHGSLFRRPVAGPAEPLLTSPRAP